MPYLHIQLTVAGSDTGPFNLYSNSDGFISAFESDVPKSSLLSGVIVDVPVGTIMIRVTSSNSICSNYVDIPVTIATTTSTSSSSTSSTSTSTSTLTTTLPPLEECDEGIDAVFIIDFTGSMQTAIINVQTAVTAITDYIETASGNNYRLALVLVDEWRTVFPSSYTSLSMYTSLPSDQKIQLPATSPAFPPSIDLTIGITILEKLAANNKVNFIASLMELLTVNFPIGSGVNTPEPLDVGIYQAIVLEKVGVLNLSSAKMVFLITDSYPGSNIDWYGQSAFDNINSYTQHFIDNNIRLNLLNDMQLISRANKKMPSGKIYSAVQDFIFLNNANGFPDPSFIMRNHPGPIRALEIDEDSLGNIYFYNYDIDASLQLKTTFGRFLPDGDYDTSFDVQNKITSGKVTKLVILPDNKVLVFGTMTAYDGVALTGTPFRLNSDGSLDNSFSVTLPSGQFGINGCLLDTGIYLILGTFTSVNGNAVQCIAAVTDTGAFYTATFDAGDGFQFLSGSVVDYYPFKCEKLQNNTIIIKHAIVDLSTTIYYHNKIINRTFIMNIDGSIVNEFKYLTGTDDLYDFSIAEFTDNRIFIADANVSSATSNGIFTCDLDGLLTSEINNMYYSGVNNMITSHIEKDSIDRILVAGTMRNPLLPGFTTQAVVRFLSDGATIDPTYLTGNVPATMNGMILNSDDSVIVTFQNSPTATTGIRKYLADGTADPGFTSTGIPLGAFVIRGCKKAIDGDILVFGGFTTFNGVARNRLVKILSSTGAFAAGFNIGTGFNNQVFGIGIQSDGKIICIGFMTSYNGNAINRIVRLNTDGSFDATFNQGTGFNNNTSGIHIMSDDKIIVTGTFTTYNDVTANGFAKLNSDGTRDMSYILPFSMTTPATTFAEDSFGNLYMGGGQSTSFVVYNSVTYRILKLDTSMNIINIEDNIYPQSGCRTIRTDIFPNRLAIGHSDISINLPELANMNGVIVLDLDDYSIDPTWGENLLEDFGGSELSVAIVNDTTVDFMGFIEDYGGDVNQYVKLRVDNTGAVVPGSNKDISPYETNILFQMSQATQGVQSRSFDAGIVEDILVNICEGSTTTTSTTTIP